MSKFLIKILYTIVTVCIFINAVGAETLDEKIGQMIILGFRGDNINSIEFKRILK